MDTMKLAALLLPEITDTPAQIEAQYPSRNLGNKQYVTRFAPSPTGFIHIGGLFAALVCERFAHRSGGIFYLRIEDTDKKREVEGGIAEIVNALAQFGILFDEGATQDGQEVGAYGRYKQSERVNIYQTYAKQLIEKGLAYPCFCTEEQLNDIRQKQEALKLTPGYYGEWAAHRTLALAEIEQFLNDGKPFVLRLKAPENTDKKFEYNDSIRGKVEIVENTQDIVLLKSDGVPTYHFAHAIDDHLMRTTHVIRGDEWLSSLPIHLQLFAFLGFTPPQYAHISPIMKMDGSSKRKLSKRKDPEAAVQYYHEQGYPKQAVIEYLLTLANSNYEDWRRDNKQTAHTDFPFSLQKMSVSGALFDLAKLTDISKNLIAEMDADTVYQNTLQWAEQYDQKLYDVLVKHEAYTKQILAIGRGVQKPRKDISKWADVAHYLSYFYDELFDGQYEFPTHLEKQSMQKMLEQYSVMYDELDDNTGWFDKVKALSESIGFVDMKTYKKDPTAYPGHVGDVSTVIRVAVTGRQNTPDLHTIMQTLRQQKVLERLQLAVSALK
ncbi:MAG: glutamate--tRNA ligase [Hyphomonadaceae bacterium]|nr:glutamate--tRNA ligase [Clostridia bacterium]